MLRAGKFFILAVVCFCFMLGTSQAKDLRVSLPYLPPLIETKDKGIIVDLVKAMADEYKDGKITWDVFPPARAFENVEKGRADLGLPYIPNGRIPVQFSSEVLYKVTFALYSNKGNKEINPVNVSKYKIETDMGAINLFDFKVAGSPNIESGLKKVDIGRIDGFIFAMPEADQVLKKLGLMNIKRWEYKTYDVKAGFPKGESGKETDKIFTDLVKKLKASGKYQKIMAPILNQKYDNWQM